MRYHGQMDMDPKSAEYRVGGWGAIYRPCLIYTVIRFGRGGSNVARSTFNSAFKWGGISSTTLTKNMAHIYSRSALLRIDAAVVNSGRPLDNVMATQKGSSRRRRRMRRRRRRRSKDTNTMLNLPDIQVANISRSFLFGPCASHVFWCEATTRPV